MKDMTIVPDDVDVFYGDQVITAPITEMEQAEVTIHKIVAIQSAVAEAEARAKALKAKVDAWLDEVKHDADGETNLLMSGLLPWARLQLQDRKTRSVKTIAGAVGFKTVQGKTSDSDKDATIKWYMDNWPDFVRAETVYKLDTKAAKAFFFESGEKAPTIDFESPHDKAFVKEA